MSYRVLRYNISYFDTFAIVLVNLYAMAEKSARFCLIPNVLRRRDYTSGRVALGAMSLIVGFFIVGPYTQVEVKRGIS